MVWEPSNQLEAERLEKLQRLRDEEIEPYPNRATRTHTTAEAIAAFEAVEAEAGEVTVTVCGRVVRRNIKGKISFMHIEDGAGRIQLFIRINNIGEALYNLLVKEKVIELGDFVQATGVMMRTRAGEASVNVSELVVLSKALSPLPVIKQQVLDDGTVKQYGEFTDPEERYRQRYADLAVNPDVREVFRVRARTISAIRRFLDDAGFLEVETPVLQPIYGGAAARPFITHHNQLHQDLYLRISFELYLKRLLVGMYDAVYEIGRDFRNEGVDRKHNPEFTQVEFYKAYIDYEGVMDLTESLVSFVAEQVTGSTEVFYQGNAIELAPPWRRVTLRDILLEHTGIDYNAHEDAAGLRDALRAKDFDAPEDASWGRLVDDMLDYAEPHMIQPHFVIDYPRDISPLAKAKPGHPKLVERFEFFIAGMEMGNAFTEINDPLDQEQRFIDMGRLYDAGDEEAHPIDEDYLRAMRYGMPPSGGFGMGVDRLAMLLSDQPNIREVLLFPHLREPDDE